MSIFDAPKIDCHVHVLDPARFPYGQDIAYKPAGQEVGTCAQLCNVMDTYGVAHALLVQPNSGYGSDNACLLDGVSAPSLQTALHHRAAVWNELPNFSHQTVRNRVAVRNPFGAKPEHVRPAGAPLYFRFLRVNRAGRDQQHCGEKDPKGHRRSSIEAW
jgi:predicted TIM-barrel fold metal-dependent hydrolase